MINITDEQLEIIKPYIEDLDLILAHNDYDTLQDELNFAIVGAFDKNDEPTDLSRELERIYDALLDQNK